MGFWLDLRIEFQAVVRAMNFRFRKIGFLRVCMSARTVSD